MEHLWGERVMLGQAKPESLLESAPIAMVGFDQAGVIRFVNRLTEVLFGFDRFNLIGEPVETLMPRSLPLIRPEHRGRYVEDPGTQEVGACLELTGRRHDGTEFPLDISVSSIETEDGPLVTAAVRDVTGRKKENEDLQRLAMIVASSGETIIGSMLDGTITSWNPAAERMYGYASEEIIGRSVSLLTPRDRSGEPTAVLARVSVGQDVEHRETNRVRKDGSVVLVSITVAPIRDVDGVVVGASAVHRDVTDQRQVFESSQRMTAIVEDSNDAIVSATLEGVMTSWNPAAERMYGYSSEEIIGRAAEVLVAEDETDVVRAVLEQIALGQQVKALETKCLRRDGVVFPITVTVSPIRAADGAVLGASAIVRDTTEQKRAFETGQLMAAIIEHSEDAIVSCTSEGIVTSWNAAAERMFGYSSEETMGKTVDFLGAKDREVETQDVLAKIKASQSVERYETYRIRKDGSSVPVAISISMIRGADGAVIGASEIYHDLTAQRQAFEVAQRMAAIVESSGDAIIGKTLDGIITSWNPAAARMYGYPSQEVIGKSVFLLSPPERIGEITNILNRLRDGQIIENFETDRVRKDGTVFPASLTVSPIRDAGGAIIGASTIARDVTAQRLAFEAAQRMAAVIDGSGESIISGSLDGTVMSWNPSAERMFGYSSQEIIGKSIACLIPEDKPGEIPVLLAKLQAGEPLKHQETTCLRKDGTMILVSVTVSPILDAKEVIIGASSIARDLTEQKRAALYARSLIETALDPLVAISCDGLITDVNEATIKVTGIPRLELIGTGFSEYFTEPDKANEMDHLAITTGVAVDYPLTMRHKSGRLTEVLYNAAVYRDINDNVLGVFAAARDVTKQMQALREISEQRAKELETLAELVAFQRVTVGRELKMIMLKQENKGLRGQLPEEGEYPSDC